MDAKPNSQCVASYVPVSAMCCADPLTVSRNVLCSRPTRCHNSSGSRAVRRADHAAGVSAYAEERGLCSAPCVSWCRVSARGLKEARADDAGGRTSATAASYAASLF